MRSRPQSGVWRITPTLIAVIFIFNKIYLKLTFCAVIGYGSSLTIEGTIEDDAIIMDGKTLNAGSVAAVTCVKHPISLARAVMERTKHCLFVGTGADQLAKELGFDLINNESLIHEFAQVFNFFF